MLHRRDITAPSNSHNLHRLIDKGLPSLARQVSKSLGHLRRSEVMEHDHRIGLGMRGASDAVNARCGSVVVAVDEHQGPLAIVLAGECFHGLWADASKKIYLPGTSGCNERLLDDGQYVGAPKYRINYIELDPGSR